MLRFFVTYYFLLMCVYFFPHDVLLYVPAMNSYFIRNSVKTNAMLGNLYSDISGYIF
jgi:hypothetical protein